MKLKSASSFLVAIIVCVRFGWAQQPAEDPIHSLLIPPNILLHHRSEIGLTESQSEQIRTRVEKAGAQTQERQTLLTKALTQLAELLSADQIDEEAALNQLNQVLAAEKELKRIHLQLMIQVRNELTADQRNVAAKIKSRTVPNQKTLQQRIQAKLTRIEREVQTRAQQGQPPFDAVGVMQKFPELMQNGQVQEAEAVLDRVIKMLGLPKEIETNKEPALPSRIEKKIRQVEQRAQKLQQGGKDVSKIKELMEQLPPLIQQDKNEEAEKLLDEALKLTGTNAAIERKELRSLADVRSTVNAMRRKDVAWRGIAWKTCLLDGLKASRDQKKPIMLWVFIDRPVDDERC